MRIGILAVQGAFALHKEILEDLGAECVELRQASDIHNLDGLVLPGGESTVQGKLIRELQMYDKLKELIDNGIPTLATCAGLILLAKEISNDENVYLATLPVTVKRNAYGRQLGSFNKVDMFKDIGDFEMTFIRAPYIEQVGNAKVLAKVDDKVVAVQYKNQLGLAFHPEMGNDNRIHKYFLQMCSR
ncbi:MAG: pyridoxal 5'-phosphate synthase glutaminase subunit PdxT [Lachnospiraceae bacterium]|nr:pyridoxal 5'-phosphate synthase glutaminase subunit PdxT [Lachnospiraceae bacterium]